MTEKDVIFRKGNLKLLILTSLEIISLLFIIS